MRRVVVQVTAAARPNQAAEVQAGVSFIPRKLNCSCQRLFNNIKVVPQSLRGTVRIKKVASTGAFFSWSDSNG